MIADIHKFIEELKAKAFYGKITVSFENGKITLIRKEETFKPETQKGAT